jgi:putative DNA primase/helicase
MKRQLKSMVRLLATAEDEATHEFFAVIEFRDIYGGVRRVQLPLADLKDLKATERFLINAGAYLPEDDSETTEALRGLQANNVARWVFASSLGWHGDDHLRFVRPRGVIGKQRDGVRVRPPRALGAYVKVIGTRGTHAGWSTHVARPARYSSRMVLAICAGFAAPLLRLTGMSSFAIYLSGTAKSGKSTLTVAAGSVMGLAREDDLPNFRTTDAALGELPMAFNDSLLPLNELGLMKGSRNQRRNRHRDLTYGLAEGRDTTRSRLFLMGKSDKVPKWHSIVLANGEETSDELAMQAGETRMAGETVRWIDLPARRPGSPDIFDRAPAFKSAAKRSAWFAKRCAALRSSCERYHGVAHRHFIKHVIRERQTIRSELVQLRADSGESGQ